MLEQANIQDPTRTFGCLSQFMDGVQCTTYYRTFDGSPNSSIKLLHILVIGD